jgi:hypothetical protein
MARMRGRRANPAPPAHRWVIRDWGRGGPRHSEPLQRRRTAPSLTPAWGLSRYPTRTAPAVSGMSTLAPWGLRAAVGSLWPSSGRRNDGLGIRMAPTGPTRSDGGWTTLARQPPLCAVTILSSSLRPACGRPPAATVFAPRSTGSFVRSLRVIRRQVIAHPTVSSDQIAAIDCAIEELLTGLLPPRRLRSGP